MTDREEPKTPSGTATSGTAEVLLVDRCVLDIDGDFFIPAYQRGYRWGPQEVRALLQDIADSQGHRYYLQPVVVKAMGDGRWELVDGQQRLTTLYLILRYLRQSNLFPTAEAQYTLDYETRPETKAYLDAPTENAHSDNIDFFHIYGAYAAIEEWFAEQGQRRLGAAINLYQALEDRVRVIWYQAAAEEDGTDLFTRLNVGRIPLTDAELVKALLLSRSRADNVRADRAQEIVAQWDSIERDLRVPEVWAFVTGTDKESPTHISLLLDTLANRDGTRDSLFYTFETLKARLNSTTPDELWDDIVDLHALVRGWYDDRDLYHWVGYLVATGSNFQQLVAQARGLTKTQFRALLADRIRTRLSLTQADVEDLSYKDDKRAEDVLLLMNVETIRRSVDSSERYSFRAHAASSWSLEHIHAQNAESLNKAEQWDEWLRLHAEALQHLPSVDDELRFDLLARIVDARDAITETKFRILEQEIVALFTTPDDADAASVHSIANLALLDRNVNSALNNSCFEVKRRAIIEKDMAGQYIPVCTRNAFLKYYTEAEGQQIHFWGPEDRAGYLSHLVSALRPYLLPAEEVSA